VASRFGFRRKEHFVRFAPLRRSRSEMVSSHNDFKPQTSSLTNTMLNCERGAAFLNDRYVGPLMSNDPILPNGSIDVTCVISAVFPFLSSFETSSQRTCGNTIFAKH